MTARATLKMTATELTRRHSVRTVTHPTGDPRGTPTLPHSLTTRPCLTQTRYTSNSCPSLNRWHTRQWEGDSRRLRLRAPARPVLRRTAPFTGVWSACRALPLAPTPSKRNVPSPTQLCALSVAVMLPVGTASVGPFPFSRPFWSRGRCVR